MNDSNEKHFISTFWYIAGITGIILVYVLMITFVPIPKENQRFVDISLAFLLGWLSSNSQYLTGGNPVTKKAESGATVQQADTVNVNSKAPNE